jgi:hypothetical protein
MTPEALAALVARLQNVLDHVGRDRLAVAVDVPDLRAAVAELAAIAALTDPAQPPATLLDPRD